MLREDGWEVQPEVSYSIYGERGSIDLLAWHPSTCTILVIEIKTELVSVEETLRKHDEKVRLAPRIAAERLGWAPVGSVGRVLVLPDLSTPRRRVARHAAALGAAYPTRGSAARAWLREPVGALSAVVFIKTQIPRGTASHRRKRVRQAASALASRAA
jgi:hypothetical protein